MTPVIVAYVFKCKICGKHHMIHSLPQENAGLRPISCVEQSDQICSYTEEDLIPIYGVIKKIYERNFVIYDEFNARVMTPQEVFGVDSDGLVYVETCGTITPALITDRTRKDGSGRTERWVATQQLGGDWLAEDLYGISWRCWTKRPLKDQMEAARWEERKNE